MNTITGHQAAYKFTGTQGTSNYTLGLWDASEAWGGTNLYRHKDAYYFLPTEDEWVKAAYWSGTGLQGWANKAGEGLHQGNGTSGTGWNYYSNTVPPGIGWATNPPGPWDVGSGSEELNGTYDMMGNVLEWVESPYISGNYLYDTYRVLRGGSSSFPDGSYPVGVNSLSSSFRNIFYTPSNEDIPNFGFRVASVPEPASIGLLFLGGVLIRRKRRR